MNKTLYKVIFNKKRGQMVAVAEHTAREGKSTQDSAPGAALSASAGAALRLPAICFSLLLAFGQAWIVPAQAAGIAADQAAPANQQPTILQTANGLPQVNIQTPTSAGVSAQPIPPIRRRRQRRDSQQQPQTTPPPTPAAGYRATRGLPAAKRG